MEELNIAWAAGFFDGEGCVTITTNAQIRLEIATTHKPSIEKFAWLFEDDPRIQIRQPRFDQNRIQYRYMAWGKRAMEIVNKIRPYSVTKREQLDMLVVYFNMYRRGNIPAKLAFIDLIREAKKRA